MIRSVLHNLSVGAFAKQCTAKCPVCGLPARSLPVASDFSNTYYACRKCGGFKTPYAAYEIKSYCNNANVSVPYGCGLISFYIQKEWLAIDAQFDDYETQNIHYAELNHDKLNGLLKKPSPSISEQISRCMQVIASEKCANGRFTPWGFGGEIGKPSWSDLLQRCQNSEDIRASAEALANLDQFYLEIIRILCANSIDEIEYFFRKCLCEEEHLLDCIPSRRPKAIGENQFDLDKFVITTKGWKFLDGRDVKENFRTVFVAMWFAVFTKPLREIIKKVLSEKDYNPVFVDELPLRRDLTPLQKGDLIANSTIDNMIIANIRRSKFVIVDLSCFPGEKLTSALYKDLDGNPLSRDLVCAGAYFEAGYASALEKPIIYLVHKNQTPHFDVNHIPYITWDETSLSDLEVALKNGIEARGL